MDDKNVFVDYGNADPDGAIRLGTRGTESDLSRLRIELVEGMLLNMSDGEIKSIGVVSRRDGYWVAVITKWLD